MGVNTFDGYRQGSVKDRTQFYNDKTNMWYKRDTETGHILSSSENKYKGVRTEPKTKEKLSK
jgi:hypothetical protein